jgi:hypothetical protein
MLNRALEDGTVGTGGSMARRFRQLGRAILGCEVGHADVGLVDAFHSVPTSETTDGTAILRAWRTVGGADPTVPRPNALRSSQGSR